MSEQPNVSVPFTEVIGEIHTTYQALISVLVNELAEAKAANKVLSAELAGAQQAARVTEYRDMEPECEETDYTNRGDCLGPVGRRTVRKFGAWGKSPGQPVWLCHSHQHMADPSELDPLPKMAGS